LIDIVKRIKPRLDEVITAGRRGARRAHAKEHEQHQCRAPLPSHSPEPSRSHHALATLVDNTLARGNRRRNVRLRCVSSIVDAHATDRCPENVPCRHSTFQEDQPKNARTRWRDQASHRTRSRKPTRLSGRRGFGPGARESIPSRTGSVSWPCGTSRSSDPIGSSSRIPVSMSTHSGRSGQDSRRAAATCSASRCCAPIDFSDGRFGSSAQAGIAVAQIKASRGPLAYERNDPGLSRLRSEPGDRIDRVRRLNSAAELEAASAAGIISWEAKQRALILAKVRCWLLRWKITLVPSNTQPRHSNPW
jgi:hypothetical protein